MSKFASPIIETTFPTLFAALPFRRSLASGSHRWIYCPKSKWPFSVQPLFRSSSTPRHLLSACRITQSIFRPQHFLHDRSTGPFNSFFFRIFEIFRPSNGIRERKKDRQKNLQLSSFSWIEWNNARNLGKPSSLSAESVDVIREPPCVIRICDGIWASGLICFL